MERINQYEFYDLGGELKALTRYYEDTPASQVIFQIYAVKAAIDRLLSSSTIPLGLSRPAAVRIQDFLARTQAELGGENLFSGPSPEAAPIPAYAWYHYRQLLTAFETIFSEEMQQAPTYVVPRRGIYLIPALVDGADQTFPSEVLQAIPEKAREEWRAAGRCLAFNLLSASGFHVARAVEGTLEFYYRSFLGKFPSEGQTWGDLIAGLEQVAQNPVPDCKTITELRRMKDDYRNPLMHPRVVLTEPDARMLFSNGESLIIAMAQEIKSVADGGIQPSLTLVDTFK